MECPLEHVDSSRSTAWSGCRPLEVGRPDRPVERLGVNRVSSASTKELNNDRSRRRQAHKCTREEMEREKGTTRKPKPSRGHVGSHHTHSELSSALLRLVPHPGALPRSFQRYAKRAVFPPNLTPNLAGWPPDSLLGPTLAARFCLSGPSDQWEMER